MLDHALDHATALRLIVSLIGSGSLYYPPQNPRFFQVEIATPEEGELQLSLFGAMSTRVARDPVSWSHMTP